MNQNNDDDKKKGCLGCLATPFGIMLIILAVILIILFFSIGGGDLLKMMWTNPSLGLWVLMMGVFAFLFILSIASWK